MTSYARHAGSLLRGLLRVSLVLGATHSGADTADPEFVVFEDGSSEVRIKLPPDPADLPDQLEDAILEFQDRVYEMGGVRIPLAEASETETAGPRIRFEAADFPESPGFPAGADERFRIKVEPDSVTIEASDPIGWEYGLYGLLDEFGGVRWFWPGELGTYTPHRSSWKIPSGSHERVPAYVSRRFSGLRSHEEKIWGRRNRLKGTFHFHHNLRNVFGREFFLEHPETLVVDWNPEDPPPPGDRFWRSHPDLTSEVVVETAAQAVIKAFDEDPTRISFSLGLDDNTDFGESPGIREWTRPMRYFRDLPDFSDLVFQFMNRVADKVSEVYPDRFLGCLAYMWNENVPSFPVHPMVVPYLTADRSQGHDVNFTESDRELVRKWTAAGPQFVGIYDYLHAAPNSFPRRANLIIGQRIRDSHEAGVEGYYAEFNPIWPLHGDLPWMVARMLWNPESKPGELEAEFFDLFFGPAQEPMKAFYDRARRVWMWQDGSAVWVKYYKDEAGIELFSSEDLQAMTNALEAALSAADQEGVFEERVRSVREAWELTLAMARLQQARRELLLNASKAKNPDNLFRFINARKQWEQILESLSQKPLTRQVSRTRFPHSDPSYHAARSLLENSSDEASRRFADELRAEAQRINDGGARVIFQLAERATRDPMRTPLISGPIRTSAGELIKTGSEPWEFSLRPPWELKASPSERVSVRYSQPGDRAALQVRDAYAVGLAYHFEVPAVSPETSDSLAYEAVVDLAAKISKGNRTYIQFQWWDQDDRFLGITRTLRLAAQKELLEGSFRAFGFPPKEAVRGSLMIATVRQEKGDLLDVFSVSVVPF